MHWDLINLAYNAQHIKQNTGPLYHEEVNTATRFVFWLVGEGADVRCAVGVGV